MTAVIVEAWEPGNPSPWAFAQLTRRDEVVQLTLTEAREIAAALHRYDLAKAHEQEVG
jgi:hypothetical protein